MVLLLALSYPTADFPHRSAFALAALSAARIICSPVCATRAGPPEKPHKHFSSPFNCFATHTPLHLPLCVCLSADAACAVRHVFAVLRGGAAARTVPFRPAPHHHPGSVCASACVEVRRRQASWPARSLVLPGHHLPTAYCTPWSPLLGSLLPQPRRASRTPMPASWWRATL